MKKDEAHIGKCIHCLLDKDNITEDHVIPKSWYSTTHSKHIYKPRAPACFECNNKLGEKEQMISHLMWMCMPETHPLRKELTEKVYRACGISADGKLLPGLSVRERRIRKLYTQKLLSLARSSNGLNEKNILPGFGYHAGYPKEIQKIVLIDNDLISDVAIKVVRGLEYVYQGQNRYIEKPYKLNVYFPENTQDPTLRVIRGKSSIFSDGTNSIQRGTDSQNPLKPIYIIRLWDQWEIWGTITHEDDEITSDL